MLYANAICYKYSILMVDITEVVSQDCQYFCDKEELYIEKQTIIIRYVPHQEWKELAMITILALADSSGHMLITHKIRSLCNEPCNIIIIMS